jgi:hypothetical protein
MIRDWRDKSWASVVEVSNGLGDNLRRQRLTLFGPNVIELVAKSTISLLVDEVSHEVGASDGVANSISYRLSTPFTSSRLPVSSYGL